jgi:hypothetical protein
MLLAVVLTAGNCDTAATDKEEEKNRNIIAMVLAASNTLTIRPAEVTLAPGGTQQFIAETTDPDCSTVNWSVVEADGITIDDDGGSIDQDGNYTAPLVIGDYYVKAVCAGDPAKSDMAAVHVATGGGGPSVEPDYTGTVTLEVIGKGSRYPYTSFNHKVAYTLQLHFQTAGSTDTFKLWYNYSTGLEPIDVTGSFYKLITPPSPGTQVTITSNGEQSFTTTTTAVLMAIDTQKNTLTITASGVTFENCISLPGGDTAKGIVESASVTVPLPIDLYHLSGVEKSASYGEYPATLSWDLTRKNP